MKKLLTILMLVLLVSPGFAQQKGKKERPADKPKPDRGVAADLIPKPDAEAERLTFKLPEGFEANLFASDPMIAKPVHMNFDTRGRLWVVSSSIYPQIKPGQTANDKLTILEDTDTDGKADKSTVFADGLLIPTAVEPGDGGAYVANSTELLHLRDTDGDGKADQTRVMLSGFGTEDTHHLIHTFRWGPDSRLYFDQSIYIHSHVETPWGPRHLLGGGVWRYQPESVKLDVYARGFINPWGHIFDPYGQSFATDGAFGEGINYTFPGAAFVQAVGIKRILRGMNPGQPKQCGLEMISGDHFPPEWQGRLITNDFRGHRVNSFALSEDGSGYASRQQPDLIVTDHVAFRPIDVKMGPDGALYLADWYNPIINHGEVDFRDPRRDHEHGRIWRITYKGRPLLKPPVIAGAPVEALLENLKSNENYTREKTRRELKERGAAAVTPALGTWVKSVTDEHQRLEALWMYQAFDVLNENLLRQMLASKDHRARAAAVRVLADYLDKLSDADQLLARAAGDDHPRVRLEAVNALRLRPSAESARAAAVALGKPLDTNLDFALWLTLRELEEQWMPAVKKDPAYLGSAGRLIFAIRAVDEPGAIAPLVSLYRAGKVGDADEQAALELIASLGGPPELDLVFDMAMDTATAPARKATLLNALVTAARNRNLKPSVKPERIAALLTSPDESVKAAAARLSGLWKIGETRPILGELAEAPASTDTLRQAAIDGLVGLDGQSTQLALVRMTQSDRPVNLRLMAAAGLAGIDLKVAARNAVDVMTDVPSGTDVSLVFDAFFSRKGGPPALAGALLEQKLPADIAALGLRKLATSGQKAPELEKRLQEAGGAAQMAQQLTPEELTALMADVKAHGNAKNGETIFRRPSMLCTICHAIGGAGGGVGPDLSSLGASAPVDYIIESLLEPSKKIKEGFNAVIVTKTDGTVMMGVQARRTDKELLLRDAADNDVAIPLGQVANQVNNPISLMPPGLTAQLRRDEFVDLVRFLSELGRAGGDYAIGSARVVRRWRVLDPSADAEDLLRQTSVATAATDDPRLTWRPAYSGVNGDLSVEEVPPVRRFFGRIFGIVRFQIDVSTPGDVLLKFNTPKGLTLFLNTEQVEAKPETKVTLPKGIATITLAYDRLDREEPLRVELMDVPGSTAQAKLVTGK